MRLILVEGAKNVGKTTNFDVVKLNKNELIEFKQNTDDKDLYIDRMFLKQYVYGKTGLNDAILCANIFDEIYIVLPKDLDIYIDTIIKRIEKDPGYNHKMQRTHTFFNKFVKECNFEQFLIEQIRRYYRLMFRLLESKLYELQAIESKETNIPINIFKFIKKTS